MICSAEARMHRGNHLCSLASVKEKIFMTLVKDGKTDFIQGYVDRYRDHSSGMLQWGREIGLHSKHSLRKWEFTAKEQGGSEWVENY